MYKRLKRQGEQDNQTLSDAPEKKFVDKSAKVTVEQNKVRQTIIAALNKPQPISVERSAKLIDSNQSDIADYFPIREMETLEELRKKSQADKNFKRALVSFLYFNITTFYYENYPDSRKSSLVKFKMRRQSRNKLKLGSAKKSVI